MAEFSQTSGGANKTWLLAGCVGVLAVMVCCVFTVLGVIVTGNLETVTALLGLSAKAQSAALAPADAPFFMAMDVDLQQAANFQKVASVFEKSAKSNLEDLKKQFAGSTSDCDFDKDIAPWWGPDAAVFLTDARNLTSGSSFSRGASGTPNLAVAVGTRDKNKAEAALTKCNKEKPTADETYKGTKLSIFKSGATAFVKNYLVIGTTADAVRATIDASAGSNNLASNRDYGTVLARLPTGRVATFYMDTATLLKAYMASASGIQPQALEQLQSYKSAGASLGFTESGVRVDSVFMLDKAKLPQCVQQLQNQPPNPLQSLKSVPADSYALVSYTNIKSLWDCTLSQMDATSRRQVQDALDQMKQQTNVDVNADVLSWMTGEFALALTPSQPLSAGMPGIGLLALVEAKDQNLINSKLDKLNVVFALGGAQFKDEQVKGTKMKVATVGTGPTAVSMGYGYLGSFLVLGGPMDALNRAVDAPQRPLGDDATFKRVRSVLPAKTNSVLYANMTGLEQLISSTLSGRERTNYQRDVQPWLKPIKAIGIAGESGATEISSGTMFVLIQGE